MNVGLFFGSFNPIHIGHLIVANYVHSQTNLNEVWFVVSPHNPLKKAHTLLNENNRIILIEKAIQGVNHLKICDIEFSLPKPSYTINTLLFLTKKYPTYSFKLILGSDNFNKIDSWKDYKKILDEYSFYVYNRSGNPLEKQSPSNVNKIDVPIIEISATKIRQMIKNGESIKFMVPDIVLEEIEKRGYYK